LNLGSPYKEDQAMPVTTLDFATTNIHTNFPIIFLQKVDKNFHK